MKGEGGHNWQSISDMMSALMMTGGKNKNYKDS